MSQRNTASDVVELLELASFLDPRFKAKYVTDEESIKDIIRNDGILIYQSTSTSDPLQSSSAPQPPPAKKKRTLGSLLKLSESEDACSPVQVSPDEMMESELTKYLHETKLDVESDPWKLHAPSYPLMSNVSKKYLAIPATSASSERLFSRSRKIVTPLRASLKPDKVDMLVFLSKNV